MFPDHIPADAALANLHKKVREEWEALVFLEELGILFLSQPSGTAAVLQSDNDEEQERPKAA